MTTAPPAVDEFGRPLPPRTVQAVDPATGEPKVRRGSVAILVWAWITVGIGGLLLLQGIAIGAIVIPQLLS